MSGCALVSEWNDLPTDVQRRLFEQAASGKSHDATLLKTRIARFRQHLALKIPEQELPEHRVAKAAPLQKVLSVRTRRPSNRTHRISKVCRETRAARPLNVDGSLLEGAWHSRHAS